MNTEELAALAAKWEAWADEYSDYHDTRTALCIKQCAAELRQLLKEGGKA